MRTLTLLVVAAACQAQPAYYPAAEWRTATPESQGVDSAALAAAIDLAGQKHLGIHSLLVIRHGYVIADASFFPYAGTAPHDMASVTKTLTSTVTGIAVGRGIVKLDDKLLSFFPEQAPADPPPAKQRITLGDMVRMESGLDCGYLPGEQELEQMKRSADWIRFALALPMKYDPGQHSAYCSPGYHLLGSAIAAAAHQTELDFARKELFGPLGVSKAVWAVDPQGRNHGWGDCHLFPHDLARLGYLYLHGGEWNGKQIVPRDWVARSIAIPSTPRGEPGGMGYEWNASNGANGRQYGGTGRGGQSLIVWPDLDMVVVSMAGGNTGDFVQSVRQAVKSDAPLPANGEGARSLRAAIAGAAHAPAATPTTALPALAKSVSGAVYDFAVNPSRIDSLSLTFGSGPEARVSFQYYGEPFSFPVGLDGVYRIADTGPLGLPGGAQGKWTSDHEFLLDINFVANINHYTLAMDFQGDHVEVAADEASGLIRRGKLTGKKR